MITQTSEISKGTQYSISAIDRRLKNYSIRGDHPLQRESEMWNNVMKGNYIADILHQYPIPPIILAEQIVNNAVIQWLIDGKQRCTNAVNFKNGTYKVGKNVERPIISYQTVKIINGDVIYEDKEFDIRGKMYEDLPKELQERFDDRTIKCEKYLNCSNEDIEYHIRRYNTSRPMTAAQRGITHIGEECARVVKKLKENNFFKNIGNYTTSEKHNGVVERVITESLMAIEFLEDWKKKQEDICTYLKKNVKVSHFNEFEEKLDRLSEVITNDVSDLFNSKESFTWFTLYDRFCKHGLDDTKFIEFLKEFKEVLHSKKVNDITYDDINSKSSKDKSVVLKKVGLLETLMNEYFCLTIENPVDDFVVENKELINFIEEFNGIDLTKQINIQPNIEKIRIAIQSLMMVCNVNNLSDNRIQSFVEDTVKSDDIEDTLLYMNSLNDWSLDVNNSSKIFDQKNLPALVKLVDYTYKNDILDEIAIKWFKQYVENFDVNSKFGANKYENYNSMIKSLDKYINYVDRKSNQTG